MLFKSTTFISKQIPRCLNYTYPRATLSKEFEAIFMFVLISENTPLTAISSEKNQFSDTHLSYNL